MEHFTEGESLYLKERKLPSNIKREIALHALQLIFFNSILFHRKDKQFYIIGIIGALLTMIPLKAKIKYFTINILTFIFFINDNSYLFYILYGYVLSATYQTIAVICMSLSKECIDFLRKFEIICFVIPCLLSIKFNYPVFILLLIIFINIYSLSSPAIEIKKHNKNQYLKELFHAIKILIAEKDYVLLAHEQKLIIDYSYTGKIQDNTKLYYQIDGYVPVHFCNIPLISKAWVFVTTGLPIMKSFYCNFFFYLFMILEMWGFLGLITPFCKWNVKLGMNQQRIALSIATRIFTGYLIYLLALMNLS